MNERFKEKKTMQDKDKIRTQFVARLKTAMADAGISEWGAGAYLAKLTKTTPKASSKWLNAESMPGRQNMEALASALGVRVEWLEYGEGNQLNETHSTYATNASKGPKLKDKVPLISWVQAGSWTEVANAYELGAAETYYYCPVPHGPNTFALQVRGESMENPHSRRSFYDGDIIFIDPDKGADHNSLVVVKLDDSNEATFKQLIIEGNEHYLKALNPTWPEPVIRINGSATICGVVIARLDVF